MFKTQIRYQPQQNKKTRITVKLLGLGVPSKLTVATQTIHIFVFWQRKRTATLLKKLVTVFIKRR